MVDPLILCSLLALYLTFELYKRSCNFKANPRGLPLPPGPKADPIIGHARHIPAEEAWVQFHQWGKSYGDVIYLNALGTGIVVLNSYKAAQNLLEKRLIYADRPKLQFIGEMMGMNRTVALCGYNDKWKRCRKLIHRVMNKVAVEMYRTDQMDVARAYALSLLKKPKDLHNNARFMSGKLILATIYGIQVETPDNEHIGYAEAAVSPTAKYVQPGSAYVNIFPILKYVPSWFPGAAWKREAIRLRNLMEKLMELPYQHVKAEVAEGVARPSFTSILMEDSSAREDDIVWSSGTMYGAGVDTTISFLVSFMMAMTLYPDVQKKAQEELDRVVGPDRLPNFEDRDSLPYLDCILKETLRWYPGLPMGLPHYVTQDDYYEGQWIPAGSTVLSNIWAMCRDESIYNDAEAFRPERYEGEEGKNVLDPRVFVFGFGRRMCAGIHFADATLYITIAYLLATFNIRKARDENGDEIEPKISFTATFTNHIDPFDYAIEPRSARAVDLIRGE